MHDARILSTASKARASTRPVRVAAEASTQSEQEEALRRRVAELESPALTSATDSLSKTAATLAKVTAERDKLRHAYDLLKGQLELLRRRILPLAQAERIDTQQLELEFA